MEFLLSIKIRCSSMTCKLHRDFFEEACEECRQEYLDMKGVGEDPAIGGGSEKRYKELTEERAKKLYEEVMLQYLKSGLQESEADRKAKAVVRKQCSIRRIAPWPWL